MPVARKYQINLQETPYYHCVSRCVRKAFLCGVDTQTGVSYEHRRGWVEQRIGLLAANFAIGVCAYAVMSNHTHLVLHINAQQANQWSDEEVLTRWHQVFAGTALTRQYMDPTQRQRLSAPQCATVRSIAAVYRARLASISWFMRALNEYIARQANKEDDCTGRFWEGRYKSQALLDEAALLACMAYVDLNPVRAGLARSLGDSHHTSIRARLQSPATTPATLQPFSDAGDAHRSPLPGSFANYASLVEHTGRCLIDKKASLPGRHVRALAVSAGQWQHMAINFERCFGQAAGTVHRLAEYRRNRQHQKASTNTPTNLFAGSAK